MQTSSTLVTTLISNGKQVKLKDRHPTHQIDGAGCSCFISHQNVLVRGEFWKDFQTSGRAMVTLTDPCTGESKGTPFASALRRSGRRFSRFGQMRRLKIKAAPPARTDGTYTQSGSTGFRMTRWCCARATGAVSTFSGSASSLRTASQVAGVWSVGSGLRASLLGHVAGRSGLL